MIRLAAFALMAYMLWAFLGARGRLQEAAAREQALSERCASLREENGRMSAALAAPPEDAVLEALARERLGLVLPGEKLFYFDETERDIHGLEAGGDP